MRSELLQKREGLEFVTWRREQLAYYGFPLRLASQVARNQHFDLHALIELAERGCPPEIAVHILTPLEDCGDAR